VRKWLTATRRFNTMNRMSAPTPWYQRLLDLAELHGVRASQPRTSNVTGQTDT
jgi:hypothetical protein